MALVVITGGARSGKSSAAQRLAEARMIDGADVTVAVFATASDAEMTDRIARHQADRPDGFRVLEVAGSLARLREVPAEALLVLDCLGTALGVAMLDVWERTAAGEDMTDAIDLPVGFEQEFSDRMWELVQWLLERQGDTIVVTNEVGSGIVPAYATGRCFRDALGRANSTLVERADAAYLAVAGRLIDIHAFPRTAQWPHD